MCSLKLEWKYSASPAENLGSQEKYHKQNKEIIEIKQESRRKYFLTPQNEERSVSSINTGTAPQVKHIHRIHNFLDIHGHVRANTGWLLLQRIPSASPLKSSR